MAFATTNTASAAAMLGWMFFDWMRGRKPSALGACIGAVVGLVAITPAAGYVTIRESVVIGLVASVISNLAAHWKSKSTLDDTLDVFPCHGVGGMVGMLMTGIFAKDVGLTSGHTIHVPAHLGALVIVSIFSFVGSWILFKITDMIIPIRVPEDQEHRRARPQPARRDRDRGRVAPGPLDQRERRPHPLGEGAGHELRLVTFESRCILADRHDDGREARSRASRPFVSFPARIHHEKPRTGCGIYGSSRAAISSAVSSIDSAATASSR